MILPGGGRELLRGVLGVDAALDRVAAQDDLVLGDGQLLAGRGHDALADDVDPGDHLGHAVLDLHARVHLQEEVLAVLQEALDGAGADVVDGARGLDADLADALAHLLVDGGRGRLLDDLLVAALDRAVALAEVDDVAVAVGEDLDLDVARDRAGSARGRRCASEKNFSPSRAAPSKAASSSDSSSATRKPLPPPPPAALTATGKPMSSAMILRASSTVATGSVVPGHDRHAGGLHQLAGARLGAHRLDRAGRRPDEGDARVLAGLGEGRVLGQEPVAGVHGLGARLAADLEDPLDVR